MRIDEYPKTMVAWGFVAFFKDMLPGKYFLVIL